MAKPVNPIRITPTNITRTTDKKNKNLVETFHYLESVKEGINDFHVREIMWAIEERIKRGDNITSYQVQLYEGFGGGNTEVRKLIEIKLEGY